MTLVLKSELVAVYKVDAAYGEVVAKADGQLKAWRQVVGTGKVVPDFGKKVPSSQAQRTMRTTFHRPVETL